GGGLSVSNCLFMDVGRVHFDLRPGLRTAVIVGNTFQGVMVMRDTSEANVQAGLNADQHAPKEPDSLTVDNLDEGDGFSTDGAWYLGKAGGDYRGVVHWAEAGDGEATATWRVNLPQAGDYTVSVWYGADPFSDRATDAPYTVRHAAGEETIRINQREHSGQWVELGTFRFEAGSAVVTLSNAANGNVLADAVRWVPVAK
ncbi:MAG TPA: hypothetical protein PKL84_19100, partial [Candidatus Hydrogenedentes bacterium]|nr:hypothetical protein [Candidatus Hydrogenedentota bacterium]